MKKYLLNGRQLAEEMGQSPGFVSVMKAAGYVFEFGTKTTLAHALKWRRQNKDFRTTSYYRAHRQGAMAAGHHNRAVAGSLFRARSER